MSFGLTLGKVPCRIPRVQAFPGARKRRKARPRAPSSVHDRMRHDPKQVYQVVPSQRRCILKGALSCTCPVGPALEIKECADLKEIETSNKPSRHTHLASASPLSFFVIIQALPDTFQCTNPARSWYCAIAEGDHLTCFISGVSHTSKKLRRRPENTFCQA